MLPNKDIKCHRTAFEKGCFDMVTQHSCQAWVRLAGTDEQGKTVDEFRCSDAWVPVLLVKNIQQSASTGAAVESFRNEMVKQNQVSLLLSASQFKLERQGG